MSHSRNSEPSPSRLLGEHQDKDLRAFSAIAGFFCSIRNLVKTSSKQRARLLEFVWVIGCTQYPSRIGQFESGLASG